jgi:hypothetical protein
MITELMFIYFKNWIGFYEASGENGKQKTTLSTSRGHRPFLVLSWETCSNPTQTAKHISRRRGIIAIIAVNLLKLKGSQRGSGTTFRSLVYAGCGPLRSPSHQP